MITVNKQDKPLGAPGIAANIEYYKAREQRANNEALVARAERERWERELDNLDRNRDADKE